MNAFNNIIGGVGKAADALFLGGAVGKSNRRNQFADYLDAGQYDQAESYAARNNAPEYAQLARMKAQTKSATDRQQTLDQDTFFTGALQQLRATPIEQRPAVLNALVPWAKRVGADDEMIANVVNVIDDDNELDALIGGLGGTALSKETFGTSPQFVRGPDGKVRAVQFGSKGNVRQQDVNGTPIPLEQRYEALNQGQQRIEQQAALQQPEFKGAQAFAQGQGREIGKQTGAAQFNIPRVAQNAAQAVDIIDQALQHPGFDSRYGLQGVLPALPGSPGADFEAVRDQIKGKAFLQAFETLKGGGQITEVEGKKATDAISRAFNPRQSPEAARAAFKEFRDIIALGVQRAQQQAETPNPYGGGQPSGAQSALPSGVTEEDIQFTMQKYGVSREEVLKRIGGQ